MIPLTLPVQELYSLGTAKLEVRAATNEFEGLQFSL